MDWLISSAQAQAAGGSPQNTLVSMLPLVLIFVVFYFLLIRPQAKRAKEHKAMVSALGVGDEVVTSGGIIGKVVHLTEALGKELGMPAVGATTWKEKLPEGWK